MSDELIALVREQQAQLCRLTDAVGRLTPSMPAITVAELMADYRTSVEFKSMRALKTEEGRIRLHINRLVGDVRVMELRDRIPWYRETRTNEKPAHRKKPCSPATRNREVVRMLAACSWAVGQGKLPSNPIAGVAMEPEENVRQTMPTADDVDKVLFAARGKRLRAMIALKFASGLRRGEVCALKLKQISLSDGLIALGHQDTKTRRPRITVLTELASRLVREYLRRRDVESIYVFCTKSGKAVSPRNFLRDYQETCDRAGVKAADGERCCLHDLRAGFVGHQLELGTYERAVMDMGGWHTHAAFDRYVRVQRRWIVDAKRRADAADAKRKPPQRAPSETSEKNLASDADLKLG